MILIIDNYDSFTYNLVQELGKLGATVAVCRNDAMSVDDILALDPEKIVISPGPGRPKQAGISLDLVKKAPRNVPILGVCLGHQVIAQAFGGKVVRTKPVHGKTETIEHDGKTIFAGIRSPFEATRYNSLTVSPKGVPRALQISARAPDREIMALRHRRRPIEGVQFHPESILTKNGKRLLSNFLKLGTPTKRSRRHARIYHLPEEMPADGIFHTVPAPRLRRRTPRKRASA